MSNNRIFTLTCLMANVPAIVFAQSPAEQASNVAALSRTTVTYREVQGHSILADILRPGGETRCPVIVWIHGGGLINGGRESVPQQFTRLAEEKKYAIVSIDYRLAPETKLPEIISDVEAAFQWIADKGAKDFNLDPNRIVVAGGSAGGYLTLITGYRVSPRPQALVSLFGYGELTSAWYGTPSPHPRHNARKISSEEAAKQTDGTVISNSRQRKGNGSMIYTHYRQNGTWPQSVSGFDPASLATKIAPFEPLRNVTATFPPTLLIHGNKDTDVPYEQSVLMADELNRHGVEATLITIENGEHGFPGGDPAQIDEAYAKMRAFIASHLDAK